MHIPFAFNNVKKNWPQSGENKLNHWDAYEKPRHDVIISPTLEILTCARILPLSPLLLASHELQSCKNCHID